MYSEHQAYYDSFRTGYWASEKAEDCRCGGCGWALSEVDTWHKCPAHYAGQPHPEDCYDWDDEGEVATTPAIAPPASEAPADDDDLPF